MSKEVPWTKPILNAFLEESGILNRIEMGDSKAIILEGIMRTRFAGWTIKAQADAFHISEDTCKRYIRELKDLYDATQRTSSILPVRTPNPKRKCNNKEHKRMVTIIKEKDHIRFKGHTRPDICAAVSSIMYTSVNMLEKYDKSCFTFEDNTVEDYIEINILRHDSVIDMVINNMFDMLNDLFEDGNKDKLEIDRS